MTENFTIEDLRAAERVLRSDLFKDFDRTPFEIVASSIGDHAERLEAEKRRLAHIDFGMANMIVGRMREAETHAGDPRTHLEAVGELRRIAEWLVAEAIWKVEASHAVDVQNHAMLGSEDFRTVLEANNEVWEIQAAILRLRKELYGTDGSRQWDRPEKVPYGVRVKDAAGRLCERRSGMMYRIGDGRACGGTDGPFYEMVYEY